LEKELSADPEIEVVGTAPDPFIARDKIVALNPDVITLDIEMPKMDGLTFLTRLMHYSPMPVIIVSSLAAKDSHTSIKALELGAFDIVHKPGSSISVSEVITEIITKIKQSYQIRTTFIAKIKNYRTADKKEFVKPVKTILSDIKTTDRLIAIGASTGGTVAIEEILKKLPGNLPPIVIVEHMPPLFTNQFAGRLNDMCKLHVKEVEDNEIIRSGYAYVAKGGIHFAIERKGAAIYSKFVDSDRVHFQKPAVDILFDSVANAIGKNALGILLTGMGKDGATGLLKMKKSGAMTVAQDEPSSIVWGMPKAAIDLNAHSIILGLHEVADYIVKWSKT
jgi:two-component system chemotaxis response regulator CheB